MKPGWPKLSTKGYKFKVKPRNAFTSLKRTIQQFKNLQCLSLIIIHAYKHRFEYYFSRRVCSHFIGGGFTSSFKTPKNFTKRNKLTRRGNSILCKHNLQHAIRDSASPNPKMLWKRKNIEVEMYYGPKYNKTAGTWSLTLVGLVNFIIFSG